MARNTPERTEATRDALLDAARHLFVTHGYADTATPDIVAAAGVTRGALYHHFADKRALFRAVVEREAARVAAMIEQSSGGSDYPLEALLAGMTGYFDAMDVAGRAQLLLVEGPAALGAADILDVDRNHALRTLEEGLATALPGMDTSALAPIADLLSAAFDRAVLAIAAGRDRQAYVAAMERLIRALVKA